MVWVQDALGCSSTTRSLTATEIFVPQVTVADVNLGCANTIAVSDINLPDGVGISQNPAELGPGTFNLVTVDGECLGQSVGTLNVVGGGSISISVQTTPSACATGTGSVDISVTGGTPPFTYSPFGPVQSGLAAGSYFLTVTDATGCSATDNFVIDNVDGPSLAIEESTVCFGALDGTLTARGSGGTPPYSYALGSGAQMPGGTDPFTFSGLAPGSYNIFVFDANGCTTIEPAVVREHPQLTLDVTFDGVSDDCSIADLTDINVTPSGGILPYDIDILDESGSLEGPFIITVVDGVGCTISERVDLTPQPLMLDVSSVVYDCEGELDFPAAVATGGCPPYMFDFIELTPGMVEILVTDQLGTVVTVIIDEEPPVLLEVADVMITTGTNTPSLLDVTVTGGTMPYVFLWLDDETGEIVSEEEDLEILVTMQQTYTFLVTDANGCSASTSVFVDFPDATFDLDEESTLVNLYPNPVSDELRMEFSSRPLAVSMLDYSGRIVQDDIDHRGSIASLDLSELPAGIYLLRVDYESVSVMKRFMKI